MSAQGDVSRTNNGGHDAASVARTLAIIRPVRARMSLAALLGAGALAASIALMGTSAWLISRSAEHPPESALAVAIVGVQFFGISRGLLRYGERLVGHDTALRLLAETRVRVYRNLEALAPEGLPAFRRGDLLARFVTDVESMQDVALRVVQPFAAAALVGTATVAVMWLILPAAGAFLLLTLVGSSTLVPWLTGRLTLRQEHRQASLRGELSNSVVDLVEGSSELVALGALDEQLARVADADLRLRDCARSGATVSGIAMALTTLLTGAACWGALVFGVRATAEGFLDRAMLAVLALVPLATFELAAPLPEATRVLHRSREAVGRVLTVIRTPPPIAEPEVPEVVPGGPHEVTMRSVWARHRDGALPALRGVDLEVPPGRRIAIVGPSGAGKSTLGQVLVRFVGIDSGEAALDGLPFERLAGEEIRKVVGLVDQNPHLFATSLEENLRVGRIDASDEELIGVLRRVGLGEWLEELPEGLQTEVGTFGTRLSGGQIQRVAVARALLARFPVLVLDEPAEHLEHRAADALVTDLLAPDEGCSVVLISHRLARLDSADEVIVLEEGRVVERGRHEDLLEAGGSYAGLWWEEQLTNG